MKGLNVRDKLQVVVVAMESKALVGFQWWEHSTPLSSWDDFMTAILKLFQPSMIQSPFEVLLGLKQTESMEEYREQFELYVGPVKGVNHLFERNFLERIERCN